MKKTPLSIILMVFNEEETIESEVLDYYQKIIKKIPGSEIIIAEDGSKDKTRTILYRLAKKIPLKLSVTPVRRGYHNSLRIALEKAKGEYVFYADAGKKHDPLDFWKLYKKRNSHDFVTGYKKVRHDPWYRLVLAKGLNVLVNLYFGVNFRDIDCGYKMFSSSVKKTLLEKKWILPNNISLEITLRAVAGGYKTTEIPVTHFARLHGESRGLPVKKIPKAVINILKYFTTLKKEIFYTI